MEASRGLDQSELRLLVIEGDNAKSYALPTRGVVTVGRSEDCEVRIDHPSLSRRHACIEIDNGIWIRELGSTNGTRLGGRRLRPEERVPLPPGELVEIGPIIAVVQGAAGDHTTTINDNNAAVMERVRKLCDRVAVGTLPVLILGETGVGKEVLAERLHEKSPRRDRPLVRLNCAALSESLFESELFGHERGAFTGAVGTKQGLLETANGGTVFLDELGELSPTMQVKLLRVIERREVLRVGGLKPIPVDVRFVSATHRDLTEEVKSGRFRADLYFRLNGISLVVPALRERRDEIEALARQFAAGACAAAKLPLVEFAPHTLVALRQYDWPGNIRELRNVIERAVLLSQKGVLHPSHLGLPTADEIPDSPNSTSAPDSGPPSDPVVEGSGPEHDRILAALWKNGGNQSATAKQLGISRRTLLKKLDKYGIARPQKGR
ncbi:MAG: sigma 54-interacting transcriptional regulator [Polyangiaceae bacterium]|nr:sigma 54-interacting transcriptional regulator [Polyangiaceae bacterium]